MELQFYPPGFAPFSDNISCDNKHWCSALNIDSLECNADLSTCNGNCEEPVNFAFIQHNGVPTGPPSPQESDLATFTPNGDTLLMRPGDTIVIHIFDAKLKGGGRALEVTEDDVTSRTVGIHDRVGRERLHEHQSGRPTFRARRSTSSPSTRARLPTTSSPGDSGRTTSTASSRSATSSRAPSLTGPNTSTRATRTGPTASARMKPADGGSGPRARRQSVLPVRRYPWGNDATQPRDRVRRLLRRDRGPRLRRHLVLGRLADIGLSEQVPGSDRCRLSRRRAGACRIRRSSS